MGDAEPWPQDPVIPPGIPRIIATSGAGTRQLARFCGDLAATGVDIRDLESWRSALYSHRVTEEFEASPDMGLCISPAVLPPVHDWSPGIRVPVPFCRLEDFLGHDRADALVHFALDRRSDFQPGTVLGTGRHEGRRSLVLPVHSPTFNTLLANSLPAVQSILGLRATLSQVETQITAHGEGDMFAIHSDAGHNDHGTGRKLSFAYYFHRRPRGFEGGQLRLYDVISRSGTVRRAATYRTVDPDHDTIVFFPSTAFHEVLPSQCRSGQFADHRFTITGWIS
jgi:Rps23 Pro-64 3,4-dihydroxylase Tpa1-like proline 4-hydroxylase